MNATKLEILFNIILYLLIIIASYKVLLKKVYRRKAIRSRERMVVALVFVFFLFAFYGGDYYHMKESFHIMQKGGINIEAPYIFISNNLSFNYTTFRFVVWGALLCLLVKIYHRLPENNFSVFVIAVLGTLTLSYARVGLAMAIMFLGSSLLIYPYSRNKVLSYILGIILVFLSYYFHKSAVFGISVILLSLISQEINKLTVFLALLSIPLTIGFLQAFIGDFMSDGANLENIVDVERGQHYMNDEYASSFGLGMIIQNTLFWTPYYITSLIVLLEILKNKYSSIDKSALYYGTVTLYVVAIATYLGLIDFGVNMNVFYYRFLNFALIPMCIFLAYCLKNGVRKKLVYITLIVGFFGSIYSLLYRFYLAA